MLADLFDFHQGHVLDSFHNFVIILDADLLDGPLGLIYSTTGMKKVGTY